MKYFSTILSIIAVAVSAFLFVRMSRMKEEEKAMKTGIEKTSEGSNFRIAYFEMDSVQENYENFKDGLNRLRADEDNMNQRLNQLNQDNQRAIIAWNQKAGTMTPAERDQAQQDIDSRGRKFMDTKKNLESEMYKRQEEFKASIRKQIEDFLSRYNKQKNYTFIFEYDPGGFIYSKDSTFNITADLLTGLNEAYQKDKPKTRK